MNNDETPEIVESYLDAESQELKARLRRLPYMAIETLSIHMMRLVSDAHARPVVFRIENVTEFRVNNFDEATRLIELSQQVLKEREPTVDIKVSDPARLDSEIHVNISNFMSELHVTPGGIKWNPTKDEMDKLIELFSTTDSSVEVIKAQILPDMPVVDRFKMLYVPCQDSGEYKHPTADQYVELIEDIKKFTDVLPVNEKLDDENAT